MCKISATVIQQDAQAVAKAVQSIADAVQGVDPSLASELNAAASALIAATSNWTTGSAIADINDAAQAIEALLSAIPITAPYATFVAIAVAGLDILIANLATQPTQTANVVANAQALEAHVETLPENPYRGVITLRPTMFHNIRQVTVNRWNQQRKLQPELNFPAI